MAQGERDTETILRQYGKYLEGFIRESNPLATPQELLAQMDVFPIIIDGVEIGIVGLKVQPTKVGSVAIIKVLYIEPQYRGGRLGLVLEQLFQRFAEQGITHVEGWAVPLVAHWLQKHWGLVPKLRVYHEEVKPLLARIAKIREIKNGSSPG